MDPVSQPGPPKLLRDVPALELRHVSVTAGGVPILRDIDLTVEPGGSACLIGRSGIGKTTLVNCVLGLDEVSEGTIHVDGISLGEKKRRQRAHIRRDKMAAIHQSDELLPELNAVENVALPAMLVGLSGREAGVRAAELLESLGIDASSQRDISTYSGGEKQRIAVARALSTHPRLLIADEPTASLDMATRDTVVRALFDTTDRLGVGLLLVSHDPAVAERADTVLDLTEHAVAPDPA